jgi:hypothetical protein
MRTPNAEGFLADVIEIVVQVLFNKVANNIFSWYDDP